MIVLLTDGYPTDDWKRPLEKLLKMPWGKKAVKVAIAIGKDAERSVLEAFTGNPEAVLDAGNPEVLTHFIKWASTVASARFQPHQQSYGGRGCAGDGAVLSGNPGTPYAGRQHHPAGFG